MRPIKLKIKVIKVGHSSGFIIPKYLIDAGLVEQGKEYEVMFNAN